MGRIVTRVAIANARKKGHEISCDALVDTGSRHLVLPKAWKERLGKLETARMVECVTAAQKIVVGEMCGPVAITIEGFERVFGEVLFLDMDPVEGQYQPLVGYLVLEHAEAAVDTVGHRLIHVKYVDLR